LCARSRTNWPIAKADINLEHSPIVQIEKHIQAACALLAYVCPLYISSPLGQWLSMGVARVSQTLGLRILILRVVATVVTFAELTSALGLIPLLLKAEGSRVAFHAGLDHLPVWFMNARLSGVKTQMLER
jgi:uncharacterized RDD family membrane protein YckC